MKILAIDTSTMITSIAVLEDDLIVGEYSINQSKTHSEMLLPMIGDVLERLGFKLKDIDAFAVAIGPGSFTGLRIGVTAVKTMAQVLDKPVIGISTLEALAYGVYSEAIIVPVIDARGKRIFTAGYKWEKGKFINIKEERLTTVDELSIDLKANNIVLVGDALEKFSDLGSNVRLATPNLNNCISKNIAVLAKKRFEDGDFDDYFTLLPNYLRKSQAEIDFGKKLCN